VVGVPDPQGISKCKAYVVLRDGSAASEALREELKQFVKEQLAPYKRPHRVEFVSDLFKTANGKIQRYKLRELGLN
jgi:benzoate-CoA ligase